MTEAIKACVAVTDARAEAHRFAAHLREHFLVADGPGWHETLTRDGVPSMSDLPGSSPYHLFLAAAEAERLPMMSDRRA